MSKEKQCECCHKWWYGSDVKEDLCPNCYYYFKQIKQQLEEKDKEIERLKVFEKAYYFNQLQASQEDIQQFQQLANQSAVNINHIAITELEKVKALLFSKAMQITGTGVDCVRLYVIDKTIDQQIKELKGEKDVKD